MTERPAEIQQKSEKIKVTKVKISRLPVRPPLVVVTLMQAFVHKKI